MRDQDHPFQTLFSMLLLQLQTEIEKGAVDLLSHGPDADIIGWNFNDGGQEEVQIHVTAKCWSTE